MNVGASVSTRASEGASCQPGPRMSSMKTSRALEPVERLFEVDRDRQPVAFGELDHRLRVLQRHRDALERLVRAEVLGQRAVAADDGQVQAQLFRDADRRVDAAPGHQHDADPGAQELFDRAAVANADRLVGREERSVEVERDEVDGGWRWHVLFHNVFGPEVRLHLRDAQRRTRRIRSPVHALPRRGPRAPCREHRPRARRSPPRGARTRRSRSAASPSR